VEQELGLRFDGQGIATVYLSCSWRKDQAEDLAYRVVAALDAERVRVVGDVRRVPGPQEAARIRRILGGCDALLCIMPWRPDDPRKTSEFVLAELRLAVEMGLPVAVFHETRVGLKTAKTADGTELALVNGETVKIPEGRMIDAPRAFDLNDQASERQAEAALVAYLKSDRFASLKRAFPHYAYVVTRLQPDFALARRATATAVQRATGLPCMWIDMPGYSTNLPNTVDRTRLLIGHAVFVVADLSYSEDNPAWENASRVHEVGMAAALERPLFLTAQVPGRRPYHEIETLQVDWWVDEADLAKRLEERLETDRARIGRHTYNWELADSRLPRPEFRADGGAAHLPPSRLEPAVADRVLLVLAVGAIGGCASYLLRRMGFPDTLDLVAFFGGATALLFAADLSRSLRRALARNSLLRWAILGAALALIVWSAVAYFLDAARR
jgi:hypothetical protein